MKQEALLLRTFEAVDVLLVFARAERRDDQRLRLAACEQRRAVRARQNVNFRKDRTHRLQIATVDARLRLQDVATHDVHLERLEGIRREGPSRSHLRRSRNAFDHGLLRRADKILTLALFLRRKRFLQRLFGELLHVGRILGLVGDLDVPRFLRGLLGELDDRLNDRLHVLVAEHHGFEHLRFRKLLGFRFDHHHRIVGAGDDEIEDAVLHLVDHRVQHELAVDDADARRADRSKERQAREGQRRGSRDQAKNVGIVLEVMRQHRHHDLRFVLETFDEERADRAIDEARRQRLLLGRAAFALEIAARNFAGGVSTFLIIHGEREKVDAGLHGARTDDGRQNGRIAVLRHDGGICLAGIVAGLELQLAATPVNFDSMDIKHVQSFVFAFSVGRTCPVGLMPADTYRAGTLCAPAAFLFCM